MEKTTQLSVFSEVESCLIFGIDKNYYEAVEKNISDESDFETIANCNLDHARYLIYKIISLAKDKIQIVSDCLDKKCYEFSPIKDMILNRIENGVKIDCLVRNKSKIPEYLLESDNVSIEQKAKTSLPFDFVVSDQKHYRIEMPPKNWVGDIFQVKALASFKKTEFAFAKKLSEAFGVLETRS